jgi:hypothetical protein
VGRAGRRRGGHAIDSRSLVRPERARPAPRREQCARGAQRPGAARQRQGTAPGRHRRLSRSRGSAHRPSLRAVRGTRDRPRVRVRREHDAQRRRPASDGKSLYNSDGRPGRPHAGRARRSGAGRRRRPGASVGSDDRRPLARRTVGPQSGSACRRLGLSARGAAPAAAPAPGVRAGRPRRRADRRGPAPGGGTSISPLDGGRARERRAALLGRAGARAAERTAGWAGGGEVGDRRERGARRAAEPAQPRDRPERARRARGARWWG